MKKDVKVLALDFGASSGRAIIGSFDGEKISLKEIHRFTNDPVILLDTMYWDVLRLFHDIKIGLIKAKQEGEIKSLGIDTWGVDFGLLNKDGKLLENPVHYRDARTKGMMEKVFAKLDKDTVYSITGNQFMELNTLFQLMALKENQPELLQKAETLLLMPDLLNYFLSNEKCTEYTIASTTQLLDAKNKTWSSEIIENLDLPKNIFTKIVQPGTKIGKLSKQISEELGINEIDVIAVAGHDTQSAMVAVPTQEDDFIFLSCGTWSLLGTELKTPIINETSASLNITNEGGADNKTSFLKNIIGLWLIQESQLKEFEDNVPPLSLKFMPFYIFGMSGAKPMNHKMFEQESEIIRRLAKDGKCIILGRCADAVLQGNENVCSVFVCANDEYREERGRTVYDGKSVIELNQEDAKRAEYYAYYTGKEWGNPKNYDLSVNTSHKSLEDIADVIIEYINKK